MRRKRFSISKRMTIMSGQNNMCLLCGQDLLGSYEDGDICRPQVDHLIPVSYKQDNSDDNLCVLCDRCNRAKGSNVFDSVYQAREFIKDKRGGVGFLPEKRLIKCKACKKTFKKKTYHQKFCCQKCKNDFFNDITLKAREEYFNRHPEEKSYKV